MTNQMKIQTLIALSLICGMACSKAAAQSTTEIVKLDRGQAYELVQEGDHWIARVYITPMGNFSKLPVSASIRSVAFGTQTDPALTGLFDQPRKFPEQGSLAAFDILSHAATSVPRGTYDLMLTISGGNSTQQIRLQMSVPGAVIRTPPAVLVTRILPILWFGGGGSHPPLLLAETSGKSSATVQVTQVDRFSDANGEYNGQLLFKQTTVAADKSQPIDYTFAGDFPLGSAKATLALTSRQIETPLNIPVEVRTRYTRVLLLLLVAIGLIFGFLMRTVLKNQVEFGEARQQAFDQIGKLRREWERIPDDTFRTELSKVIKDLEDAARSARLSKSSDLTASINSAKEQLGRTIDRLNERGKEVQPKLDQLAAVTEKRWRAPKPVLDALGTSGAVLLKARASLAQSNVAAAKNAIDGVVVDLARSIDAVIPQWQGTLSGFVNDLTRPASLMLPDVKADVEKKATDLAEKVRTISHIGPAAEISKITALLTDIDDAMWQAESLLALLGEQVKQTFAQMTSTLGASLRDQTRWNTALENTIKYIDDLPRVVEDLKKKSEPMRNGAEKLKQEWLQALMAQKHDQETKELYNQGKYVEASKQLVQALEPPKKGTLMGDQAEPVRPLQVLALPSRFVSIPTSSELIETPKAYYPTQRVLESIQALEIQTKVQLLRAKSAQWAISAVGLAIVGYLLFADKFVGTAGELLTAFFWGFTTDIGLDALVSAGKTKIAS